MTDKSSTTLRRLMERPAMSDVLTASGIAAFALCGLLFINPEGVKVFPTLGGITWQTLPLGYSWILLALSAIYLAQSLVTLLRTQAGYLPPARSAGEKAAGRKILVRRIGTVVLLLVFISLLQQIGLAIAAPLFLFAVLRLYQNGSVGEDLAISLVGGLALWVLFVPVLRLDLEGRYFDPVTPALEATLRTVGF